MAALTSLAVVLYAVRPIYHAVQLSTMATASGGVCVLLAVFSGTVLVLLAVVFLGTCTAGHMILAGYPCSQGSFTRSGPSSTVASV